MPKRQKRSKDDKILDCERPPPALTLANFLDAQLATQNVTDEYATAAADDVTTQGDDVTNAEVATAGSDAKVSGPAYTIRKNKKGTLPISYENRSKGKKVTVIANVTGNASELVSELKRATGTGGVQKGECIELQGDRRDFLTKFLKGHPCVVNR